MSNTLQQLWLGDILEDRIELTLGELCRASRMPAEQVIELVGQGVIEPLYPQSPADWCFAGVSLRRVRCAQRLQRDLGINTAGVALALDLLDELDAMRTRLRRLEG